jgi:predicted flap endonuclease-1-like 5' DNA nuclease
MPNGWLTDLEGIGEVYEAKLKEAGITKTIDILIVGATPGGRKRIAASTGISMKYILEWVNIVDLFRIKGVGVEYAFLLREAGVDTVPELAQRNPNNLHQKILEVNDRKNLVRRTPALSQVESWVAQARKLPRMITY